VGLVFARKGNKERDGGGGSGDGIVGLVVVGLVVVGLVVVGLVVVGLLFERKENNKRDGVCTRN
jgi:hypothetical protein